MDEKGLWTRQATDVMTAWADGGDARRFVASKVAHYVGEPEGAMKLTAGFINLAAILLVTLKDLSGSDTHTLLQDAAKVTFQAEDVLATRSGTAGIAVVGGNRRQSSFHRSSCSTLLRAYGRGWVR